MTRPTKLYLLLYLEANRLAATTSTLELSSLGSNIRLDSIVSVRVVHGGAVSEVPNCLARALGASEKNRIGPLRRLKSKLIEGQALTTSLDDTRSSILGESEGANLKGGHIQQAGVIRDGAHYHSDLAILILHIPCETRQRKRRIINTRHAQSFGDNSSELRVGASSDEAKQLN